MRRLDGMAAGDSSSDWNAPAEHWGNCDEGSAIPEPPAKGQSVANKVMLITSIEQDEVSSLSEIRLQVDICVVSFLTEGLR